LDVENLMIDQLVSFVRFDLLTPFLQSDRFTEFFIGILSVM
jgi:hypothetical protein